MKKGSTLFLKGVIVIIGLGVLAICTFALPSAIGSDNTGYYLPILIGMYITAIPFLIALWQALKILNYIDNNTAFSEMSVKALKNIKYCAIAIGVFYSAGMPYIFYAANLDDAPGVVAIGLVIIGASLVIAVFSSILQKLLKNAIQMKSENDLTV